MTTIIKTFFIKKDIFCPNEINEQLEKYYPIIKDNKGLKGRLYSIDDSKVVRYYWNSFEIFTNSDKENYQIKSELEKILDIKLIEPN